MTKLGSITGHRRDYNGVGATRDQQHIHSKINPSTPAPLGYSGNQLHYSVNRDFNTVASVIHPLNNRDKDPVVRTLVGTNPGLNFNLDVGFFFSFSSKALSRIIFHILFGVSNHQIVGKEN